MSLITLKHWANVGPMQNEMLGQRRHAGLDVLGQYWPDVGPPHGCPPGQYWQTKFKTLDNTGKTERCRFSTGDAGSGDALAARCRTDVFCSLTIAHWSNFNVVLMLQCRSTASNYFKLILH